MDKILVIGIGDKQRGDDGIGPVAVDLLAKKIQDSRIEYMHVPLLTQDLAEKVSQHDLVIFIDTAVDAPPGSVSDHPLDPSEAPDVMTNNVGPPQLLALAQVTFGHCPKAHMFSMGGAWMGFGHKLSKDVILSLPELLQRMRAYIQENLGMKKTGFFSGFSIRWKR